MGNKSANEKIEKENQKNFEPFEYEFIKEKFKKNATLNNGFISYSHQIQLFNEIYLESKS